MDIAYVKKWLNNAKHELVGGFNPSEKYSSKWASSPNRNEIKHVWNHHLVKAILFSHAFWRSSEVPPPLRGECSSGCETRVKVSHPVTGAKLEVFVWWYFSVFQFSYHMKSYMNIQLSSIISTLGCYSNIRSLAVCNSCSLSLCVCAWIWVTLERWNNNYRQTQCSLPWGSSLRGCCIEMQHKFGGICAYQIWRNWLATHVFPAPFSWPSVGQPIPKQPIRSHRHELLSHRAGERSRVRLLIFSSSLQASISCLMNSELRFSVSAKSNFCFPSNQWVTCEIAAIFEA